VIRRGTPVEVLIEGTRGSEKGRLAANYKGEGAVTLRVSASLSERAHTSVIPGYRVLLVRETT
jgi:hypothetical protein